MNKLQILEKNLSLVAGVKIEIAIRGEKSFTYLFDGENSDAETKLKNYFSGYGKFDEYGAGYDEESDCTVLYHEL